jgi:predicted DsbA family dithiol-disulfide isomerase
METFAAPWALASPNAVPIQETTVQIEIWSDVVCPWCAIGKRRFEAALADFAHRDDVDVWWRSYELDPSAPRRRPEPLVEHLADKYELDQQRAQEFQDFMTSMAAEEGLAFRLDIARPGNTFDAHRLLHLAAERGLQDTVKERFLIAYLCDGEAVGEPEVLARLAGEAGLDAGEVEAVLSGDAYADAVRTDQRAARQLGISGVPFFAFNRTHGVSGAQPPDVFAQALDEAWATTRPLEPVGEAGETTCGPGGCA